MGSISPPVLAAERFRNLGLGRLDERRLALPKGLADSLKVVGGRRDGLGQVLGRGRVGLLGEAVRASAFGMSTRAISPPGPAWISSLRAITGRPLFDQIERQRAWMEEVARFHDRYERTRWWYVVHLVGVRIVRRLGRLERHEIESALLDALEEVAADPDVVAALTQLVDQLPHATASQRAHLRHGLEHLGQREFVLALPSLLDGFEGVLWRIGVAELVITAERTRIDKPTRSVDSVEHVVKKLTWVTEHLQRFVIRCIFGGEGNPYRHGDYEGGERERTLWIFVALTALLDRVSDQPVQAAIGRQLEEHLVATIEPRPRQLAA